MMGESDSDECGDHPPPTCTSGQPVYPLLSLYNVVYMYMYTCITYMYGVHRQCTLFPLYHRNKANMHMCMSVEFSPVHVRMCCTCVGRLFWI